MHPSFKSITRALLCTALLSSLVHAAFAAENAATAQTAAEKTLATALAKPIAEKILADKNAIKDPAAINKMINEGVAATAYADVPAIAKAVRELVLAQVKDAYAATTADALVQSSAAAAPAGNASESEVLAKFDTKYVNKTVLQTFHIFSGYYDMPISISNNWSGGLEISASLPVGTTSLRDYANNELLLKDGGLLNVFLSFAPAKPSVIKDHNSNARRFAVGRHYWVGQDALKDAPGAHIYFPHGLGMKLVKTSTTTTDAAMTGVGVAYCGIGVDGHIFTINDEAKRKNQGYYSVELTAAENVTSRYALRALYGAAPALAAKTNFGSWGAQAKIYIVDEVFISAGYFKPLDRPARDLIHEVATFSIGFNRGAAAAK